MKYISKIFAFYLILILQLNVYKAYSQSLPFSSGIYYLQNVATGQMMYVPDIQDNGTSVTQTTNAYNTNTQFEVFKSDAGENIFQISPFWDEGEETVRLNLAANGGGVGNNPDNTRLKLWEGADNSFCKWKLESTGQPLTFVIRSLESNRPIGVHNTNQPEIIQWNLNASVDTRFQWRIIPVVSPGFYKLRNRATGKIMELPGFACNSGAKVSQTQNDWDINNQKFEITSTDELYANIFSLSPSHSKGTKFLDNRNASDNQQLQLFQSQGDDSHTNWRLIDVSTNYETQFVVIQSTITNKIIGVNSASDERIVNWGSNFSQDPRFQWELEYTDPVRYLEPGRYSIVNKATSKVWTVPGATLNLNTQLQENPDSNQPNQQFDISINDNGQYNIAPVHARGTRLVFVNGSSPTANTNGTPVGIFTAFQHPAAELDIYALDDSLIADDGNLLYGIRSLYSKLDVGVHNNSGKTEIMQWNVNWGVQNDARFQWIFQLVDQDEYIKPGNYLIQNVATGKVMGVPGFDNKLGAGVMQQSYFGASFKNQQFNIQPNGNGYTISPLHTTNRYLNVCGCANQNNFPITIWSEYWDVERFSFNLLTYDDYGSPIYTITSMYSSLDVGVHSSDNPRVMQWNVNWGIENDARFQWRFIPIGSSQARQLAQEAPTNDNSSLEPSLSIYPNPTTDQFSVEIKDFSETEDLSIVISDAMGTPILQKNIGKERQLYFDAQVLGLSAKNYVLQISNGIDKRVSKILKLEEK